MHLVHVHERLLDEGPGAYAGTGQGYDPRLYEGLRQAMRTEHFGLAAQLTRETSLPVDAEFLEGPVVVALERYLTARPRSLVVMMTHGIGGLKRAWLGSVADGLIRRAPVPILLLRSGAEWPGNLVEPLFRRVVVPLDGSAMAEEILDLLAPLGTAGETVYTLLTVIRPLPLGDYPVPVAESWTGRSEVEAQRDAAIAYLSGVAERLRQHVSRVETHVVVHSRTAEGILDEAETRHADLIALATHGWGGAARLFVGSVADKVVRGASVPVFIFRPRHAAAADPEAGSDAR